MVNYRENLEIDLKDLVREILKKWKLLIAGVILGGVVALLYTGLTPYIDGASDEPKLTQEVTDQEVAKLALALSVKEKNDVDLAYKAYKEVMNLQEQLDSTSGEVSLDTQTNIVQATQQILGISSTFTSGQKAYYAALVANDTDIETMASAYQELTVSKNSGGVDAKAFAKSGVLGGISGLLIVVAIITIQYILAPVIKSEDDLRVAFGLPVIGSMDSSPDSITTFIYCGITACAKKINAKKIYFISSIEDEQLTSSRAKIVNLFEEKDLSVVAKGSILTDVSIIDEVVTSDGVILFEKIGKTLYEDIAREIELCNNCGVPILGAVVIR